jgi:hypothetical protein
MDAYVVFLIALPIWGAALAGSGLLDKFTNK